MTCCSAPAGPCCTAGWWRGATPTTGTIFPKKPAVKATVTAAPLLAAVRQAAVMVDDETKRVAFHFGKHKLTLEAQGVNTGRSKVELPIAYEGKAMNLGFNPRVADADAQGRAARRRADAGPDRRRHAGADPLRGGLLVFGGADGDCGAA